MTRFDTDLASRGWALIAEGATMISLAYAANESASAREAEPDGVPTALASPAGVVPPAPAGPPLKPQVDAGLAICPIHGVPWTVKPAGVSRAGVEYESFYKCSEKTGDEWCKQKPQKIWRDTHPIRESA